MADDDFDIRKFSSDFAKSLHPSKPIYRKVGWRNGHRVYQVVGWRVGDRFVRMRRMPYLRLQLKTGDPVKMKRERRMLRFFRVLRWNALNRKYPV